MHQMQGLSVLLSFFFAFFFFFCGRRSRLLFCACSREISAQNGDRDHQGLTKQAYDFGNEVKINLFLGVFLNDMLVRLNMNKL